MQRLRHFNAPPSYRLTAIVNFIASFSGSFCNFQLENISEMTANDRLPEGRQPISTPHRLLQPMFALSPSNLQPGFHPSFCSFHFSISEETSGETISFCRTKCQFAFGPEKLLVLQLRSPPFHRLMSVFIHLQVIVNKLGEGRASFSESTHLIDT